MLSEKGEFWRLWGVTADHLLEGMKNLKTPPKPENAPVTPPSSLVSTALINPPLTNGLLLPGRTFPQSQTSPGNQNSQRELGPNRLPSSSRKPRPLWGAAEAAL